MYFGVIHRMDEIMNANQMALAFTQAEGPSQQLDRAMALIAGFRSRSGPSPGEEFWTSPSGIQLLKLPQFSANLHDTIELAEALFPDSIIGVSWEYGSASGKIGDAPVQQAKTPSLALCAAIVASYPHGS